MAAKARRGVSGTATVLPPTAAAFDALSAAVKVSKPKPKARG